MSSEEPNQSVSRKRKKREDESSHHSLHVPSTPHSSNQPVNSDSITSNPTGQDDIPSSEAPLEEPSHKRGLGPVGRQTSQVWNHFKQVNIGDVKKAKCMYCKKQLTGGHRSGTRHLHDHLKSCVRRKYHDVQQKMLAGTKTPSSKPQLTTYTFDEESGRKGLAEMIILHEYPLSMVDHYGFRKFCSILQPLFKIITRNTLKKDILQIYDIEKAKMKGLLNKNRGRVAVTCDMWSSNNQNKSYMAITHTFSIILGLYKAVS